MKTNYKTTLPLLAFSCLVFTLSAQKISTVAGDTIAAGFSGDGGQATSAELSEPSDVITDVDGNIYIADIGNNRVRKVATTGIITTIAGNGTGGYNGDGILATLAELNEPYGLAIDKAGNLYIGDEINQRIRLVTISTGLISTIAGNGVAGFFGDGGAASLSELNYAVGIAIDTTGNVYIADQENQRVRKISKATGFITTVAGTGTIGSTGDGGLAAFAQLNYPGFIAVDLTGNLYISEYNGYCIRKVDAATTIITTVAGDTIQGYSGDGGAATSAELNNPIGIAIDGSGNLYIGDFGNSRIRKVSTTGKISTYAGNGIAGFSGDGGAASNAEINYPSGVNIDASGNIYIADLENQRVRKINSVTGINEVAVSEDVQVYPNPTTGSFIVELSAISGQWSVEVYNVLGERVFSDFQSAWRTSNYQIDLSNNPSGIYIMSLTTQNGVINKRILKE